MDVFCLPAATEAVLFNKLEEFLKICMEKRLRLLALKFKRFRQETTLVPSHRLWRWL